MKTSLICLFVVVVFTLNKQCCIPNGNVIKTIEKENLSLINECNCYGDFQYPDFDYSPYFNFTFDFSSIFFYRNIQHGCINVNGSIAVESPYKIPSNSQYTCTLSQTPIDEENHIIHINNYYNHQLQTLNNTTINTYKRNYNYKFFSCILTLSNTSSIISFGQMEINFKDINNVDDRCKSIDENVPTESTESVSIEETPTTTSTPTEYTTTGSTESTSTQSQTEETQSSSIQTEETQSSSIQTEETQSSSLLTEDMESSSIQTEDTELSTEIVEETIPTKEEESIENKHKNYTQIIFWIIGFLVAGIIIFYIIKIFSCNQKIRIQPQQPTNTFNHI